jgi:PHD/YefM family antitoxin component YafN of YafNO toxin-antitoxin module
MHKLDKIDGPGRIAMPVKLKSSHVQQNFGQVIDRALTEDDVIVERYGAPRVAIVAYQRYERLLEVERELLRTRLQQASEVASARAAHLTEEAVEELIERARSEVHQEKAKT